MSGNPVNTATGNKFQAETDYRGRGAYPLALVRSYNSHPNDSDAIGSFGQYWRSNYDRSLRIMAFQANSDTDTQIQTTYVVAVRADGRQIRYETPSGTNCSDDCIPAGTLLTAPANAPETLEKTSTGFRLRDTDDTIENYDLYGQLVSIQTLGGLAQTLTYDSAGHLQAVTDPGSRSLTFTWISGRIATMTDPAGKVYQYSYNSQGDLEFVTYPGSTQRQYVYGFANHPWPELHHLLTGIVDENGSLFAEFSYDTTGRAIQSKHAGGADQKTFTYNADGTTTEVDAIGTTRTLSYAQSFGRYSLAGSTQPCGTCGGVAQAFTYDANGYMSSRSDFNGNVTNYVHDARGLETSRTEAYGTSLERTTSTQWHTSFRRVTQIDKPGRRTTFTYDTSGNRLSETILDTTTLESRTWSWTYNSSGQVLTLDGPRTDVSDVTTFAYDAQGNLASITNALGHVTYINQYDAHGNPTKITDPNGVETLLTYDLRQRLETRSVAGAVTSFDYNGEGQITKVTLPGGSFMSYTYDAAHRLTDVQDNAGNKIHYTLDLLGKHTKEETFDPSGTLKRQASFVYNELSRLQKVMNAAGDVTSEFGYDAQGNRTSQLDAGSFTTTFVPDALNRIHLVTDAAGGVTQYGHNALNQLTSVTDAQNLVTAYTRNAFDGVTQQQSPDTGKTSYTFDAAGNVRSLTDARGITVNFSYDALNRLIAIDYPGTAEDVTYSYDSNAQANGKGRLTGIIDKAGTTTLTYDARGNVTQELRVIAGNTYTTSYAYDSADRVTGMTYASGRSITFTRNALGQVTKVTTTVGGITTTVAQNVTYLPFGNVNGYDLANGISVAHEFDQNYRLTKFTDTGVLNRTLSYDARDLVTSIVDSLDNSKSQALTYDELQRLATASGSYGSLSYTYDPVGNRLTESRNNVADNYEYPSDSHRLTSVSGGHTSSLTYDLAGNATSRGGLTLAFNNAGRAETFSQGTATISATYSAAGQRVLKTAAGIRTVFEYDRAGHLISETSNGPTVLREFIWLGDNQLELVSKRVVSETIVSSTGAGFSTTGHWTNVNSAGRSYTIRDVAQANGASAKVDATYATPQGVPSYTPRTGPSSSNNGTASYTGVWEPLVGIVSTNPPCNDPLCAVMDVIRGLVPIATSNGLRSVAADPTTGKASLTWSLTLPLSGRYRIFAEWPYYAPAGLATFTVTAPGHSKSVSINQQFNSGLYLGYYDFNSLALTSVSPQAGSIAVAGNLLATGIENTDGEQARWLPPADPDTYAQFGSASYQVYVRWPSVNGASKVAPFAVKHSAGTTSFVEDQTVNAGQWNLLGTFTFSSPVTQGVFLGADPDAIVVADAVRFEPVASQAMVTLTAFVHGDHLGTPQKMTDSSGAVVWSAAYEPFGAATITKSAGFDNPLRLPGQYFDSETGLLQNWHRDYDPSIGRYLQSDPMGLDGGDLNVYAYVGSNPLGFIDPEGLLRYAGSLSKSSIQETERTNATNTVPLMPWNTPSYPLKRGPNATCVQNCNSTFAECQNNDAKDYLEEMENCKTRISRSGPTSINCEIGVTAGYMAIERNTKNAFDKCRASCQ